MNYKTVERCGRTHIVKNGVESAEFVQQAPNGRWATTMPQVEFLTNTRAIALNLIAEGMDDWHAVSQAAARLVELGKVAKLPVMQTMYRWIREGRFPGAIKAPMVGRGGAWRLSETSLVEFKGGKGK